MTFMNIDSNISPNNMGHYYESEPSFNYFNGNCEDLSGLMEEFSPHISEHQAFDLPSHQCNNPILYAERGYSQPYAGGNVIDGSYPSNLSDEELELYPADVSQNINSSEDVFLPIDNIQIPSDTITSRYFHDQNQLPVANTRTIVAKRTARVQSFASINSSRGWKKLFCESKFSDVKFSFLTRTRRESTSYFPDNLYGSIQYRIQICAENLDSIDNSAAYITRVSLNKYNVTDTNPEDNDVDNAFCPKKSLLASTFQLTEKKDIMTADLKIKVSSNLSHSRLSVEYQLRIAIHDGDNRDAVVFKSSPFRIYARKPNNPPTAHPKSAAKANVQSVEKSSKTRVKSNSFNIRPNDIPAIKYFKLKLNELAGIYGRLSGQEKAKSCQLLSPLVKSLSQSS